MYESSANGSQASYIRDIERLKATYRENATVMAQLFAEQGATGQERSLFSAIESRVRWRKK
jgi:hypothetical protein